MGKGYIATNVDSGLHRLTAAGGKWSQYSIKQSWMESSGQLWVYAIPRGILFGYIHLGLQRTTSALFTALHEMQTRSSDENSVCPSVCPSHA